MDNYLIYTLIDSIDSMINNSGAMKTQFLTTLNLLNDVQNSSKSLKSIYILSSTVGLLATLLLQVSNVDEGYGIVSRMLKMSHYIII